MEVNNESYNNSNQVANNRADNPLKISNEDIKQVLQVKCKRHPERQAKLLLLVPDVENARICNMCVQEDDISRKNYQDIRELFLEQSERDLLSYPVLTGIEYGMMVQTIRESIDSEAILMDKALRELTKQIEVKIRGRKEGQKIQLGQYGDIYERSQVCWSEIMDLENLQRILLDKNNEERLAQFVRNHVSNAERNTQKIKTICDQYRSIKDEFSVEQPNKIISLVCGLIEEIDFFHRSHPSPLHAIEQSDEYQNVLQRKQQELNDFQSQANQAQRTMHEKQQQLLEEMRILKEKHQKEINSLKQKNSYLKQDILDQKQYISGWKKENLALHKENSHLKQSTSDQNQEISGLKQKNQAVKEDNSLLEQSTKSQNQEISDLKKENQATKEENSHLKQSTSRQSQEISDLKQENQTTKEENSRLKQSTSSQNQEISDLKQENQAAKEKNSLLQQITYDLNQEISNLKIENQSKKEENSHIKQRINVQNQEISDLKQENLTIEKELHSFKPTDLLLKTKLILGNYFSSKKLSITKNNQQELEFTNDTKEYCGGLSYLDFVLNPSINYVVHVQLQQIKGQDKMFSFGLLPDSLKDATTGILTGLLQYSEQEGNGDLNTQLKRKVIQTDDNLLERRSLEMRINISRQVLRVGSLPNYESVVQINNPKLIEPATPYRFFLWGLNMQTKMTITYLKAVSQFDKLM